MAIGALCSACSDACPCIAPAPAPTDGEKFPLIGRELLLPRLLASLPRREFGVESKLEEEESRRRSRQESHAEMKETGKKNVLEQRMTDSENKSTLPTQKQNAERTQRDHFANRWHCC